MKKQNKIYLFFKKNMQVKSCFHFVFSTLDKQFFFKKKVIHSNFWKYE
jgi:hypothetical protein